MRRGCVKQDPSCVPLFHSGRRSRINTPPVQLIATTLPSPTLFHARQLNRSMTLRRSTDGVSYPPLDGSLFLPEMIEFNAEHNPACPFFTFYDERIDDLRHVSHLKFYRACQRIAHAVRPDRQGPDDAIVAIIANSDTILYQSLTLGVIYAGLIVRPLSLAEIRGLIFFFFFSFP